MAANSKSKQQRIAENWKSVGAADGLDPAEQIAHAIISERRDLLPSVERIMTASLNADEREHALNLFRDSLLTAGDPNRDPRVAIAASSGASA